MLTMNYQTDENVVKSVLEGVFTDAKVKMLLDQYLALFEWEYINATHRQYVELFITGLFSNLERKSIEPIALTLKGPGSVRGFQNFFSRSTFNTGDFLGKYQSLVDEHLSGGEGMISVDETDFVKKGDCSPGVSRQYCGRLGKRENCQAGVFLAYANKKGHALYDCQLYIPKKWYTSEYEDKYSKAKIPENLPFKTKNEIAIELLDKVLSSKSLEIKWVGCDASFGSDHGLLESLPDTVYYFAGVRKNEKIFRSMPEMIPSERAGQGGKRRVHPSFPPIYVEEIANDDSIPWERVFLADSAKGPIHADTKCVRCVSYKTSFSGKSGRTKLTVPDKEIWLYIRKHEDGAIKYFVSNAPADISRSELDQACVMRWPIEQCFKECKGRLGMADYETHTYCAWERHMLFVMMAHFFTVMLQISLKKSDAA